MILPEGIRLLNVNLGARGGLPLCELLVREDPEAPQTLKVAATAVFVCQNEEVSLIACCGCRQEEIKLGLN